MLANAFKALKKSKLRVAGNPEKKTFKAGTNGESCQKTEIKAVALGHDQVMKWFGSLMLATVFKT